LKSQAAAKGKKGISAEEASNALASSVHLLPYQQSWADDNSPLKIVVKGRQTGYSFAATLRATLRCITARTTWIFLSKGERQSQMLMEKVRDHIRSAGMLMECQECTSMDGTLMKQLEIRFPNGSVIYGLPANPDTARGYSGNVTLDEFAFHADAERIYAALYPIITRGHGLEIISTPNGQLGKFYEIAKEVGLTEPRSETGDSKAGGRVPSGESRASRWSGHWCDIYQAERQGLKVDLELLRAGVDDETWRQEFCCEFISGGAQWIPPELFQQCVSSEASAGTESLNHRFTDSMKKSGNDSILYAGWDIARNRDLSVIWLSELVGDVTWTRGVIEMRDTPTPDQVQRVRGLMPLIRRLEIDRSGMGLAISEELEREFPGKVEGVQFTQNSKEELAVHAKRRMEEMKVRIPDELNVRASFSSVKRTQNAIGQFRFDTEHDAKFGHADHWWAFCLAEVAAQQPTYHLAGVGRVVGRPDMQGMRELEF
jgi:phage FluMu gp28-like protein